MPCSTSASVWFALKKDLGEAVQSRAIGELNTRRAGILHEGLLLLGVQQTDRQVGSKALPI